MHPTFKTNWMCAIVANLTSEVSMNSKLLCQYHAISEMIVSKLAAEHKESKNSSAIQGAQ